MKAPPSGALCCWSHVSSAHERKQLLMHAAWHGLPNTSIGISSWGETCVRVLACACVCACICVCVLLPSHGWSVLFPGIARAKEVAATQLAAAHGRRTLAFSGASPLNEPRHGCPNMRHSLDSCAWRDLAKRQGSAHCRQHPSARCT